MGERRRRASGKLLPAFPGLAELVSLVRHLELRAVSRWVGLGLAVGILSGLAACLLYVSIEATRHLIVHEWAGAELLEPAGEPALFRGEERGDAHPARPWILILAPAVAACCSAALVALFCREAAGGNEAWLEAFHQRRGRIRPRVALIKLVAAAIHLGGGASAGKEGPIAHIGAALGSWVGKALRLNDRERRLLLVAGAAGGIGAIFRTPLGGALFVVEVLYRDDLEVDALVPAVLSSVVAYSLFTTIFGEGALFAVAQHYHVDARELPLFGLMAISCGAVGTVFVRAHEKVARLAKTLPWPSPLIALLGGALVGLLALIHPSALGAGYGWMQEALLPTGLIGSGWDGVSTMLLIAVIKVLATSISASTAAAGGVFGPSVVIGGMVGGAYGMAFHQWAPEVVTDPSSYMLVGMACFVGGVTSCPISTLIMSCEMTGSYELLVPTMLAEVITFTLIRKSRLYAEQVATRRDSPAHGGEYVLDVLQDLKVKDVFVPGDVAVVDRSLPLGVLLRKASESAQVVFPVAGEKGVPDGLVTLDTIKAYFHDESVGLLAIAADCASPFASVTTEDSLAFALESMAKTSYQQLPVVSVGPEARLVGWISYDHLLQTYTRELSERRRAAEGTGSDPAPPE